MIGEVGLSGFDAKHAGALIGYWLLPDGRGQGLATASVRAVTEWAHEELGIAVIVARCEWRVQVPDNPRSDRQLLARVGYRNERRDSSGHELCDQSYARLDLTAASFGV